MRNDHSEIAVIYWGPHSRHGTDIANHLGGTLHLIHTFSWRQHSLLAPLKYLIQNAMTWFRLWRTRPAAVYVIIPPTFAALSVSLYCLVAGIPFVLCVHGHSLTSKKWGWTAPLQRFLARRALATVVNEGVYARIFEDWGAKTYTLERCPMPLADRTRSAVPTPEFSVTLVSIFAEDEPVREVIEAARRLPDITFTITGDTKRADPALLAGAPANVRFPGYLDGDEYWALMGASRAIMTLTTEPISLVSGGIEAMALRKPVILSRQPALVEYFTQGTVFVENTVDDIVRGVEQARHDEARLTHEIAALGAAKSRRWTSELDDLLGVIVRRTTSGRLAS